jgi:integrase
MSLFRDPRSPYWQFEFRIQGYRFFGSSKCTDKRDAAAVEEAEKAKAKILVERLAADARSPMTIERACARWWNEHGRHLNEPDAKARLDWLVAQIGPRTALHAINDDTVANLVEERRLDVRRAGVDEKGKQLYRPITATTVNKTTIVLLRRVLRRARDNWNAALPSEPIWKKHMLKQTRHQVRELTPIEDTALDAIERRDYALVRKFAEITGLRRRELLLTWSQVDLEAGIIRVIAKGGVPRVLPLTREAYAIVWSRRGHHPEFVFTYEAERTRQIPKGSARGAERIKGQRYPITYAGLGSNKQRHWIKAGVDARIHDLRHTTGMRTLRATGNLKLVQKLLGHTDIAITAKFYTDATLEDLRAGMETTAAAQPAPLQIEHKKSEGEE